MTKLIGILIAIAVGWWLAGDPEVEVVKEFYENGQVKREGTYVDGDWEGNWKTYHDNGQVMWERNYNYGEKDGRETFYHRDGELFDEDIWEDGECVEMCEGDEID
jgi:antitoxin component YwqK of YwqJK toxin-antitoxin module